MTTSGRLVESPCQTDTSLDSSQTNRYFPWIVAAMGLVLLLFYNSFNATFGVFFKPIIDELGWNRGTLAGTLLVRSLISIVLVVPMGYWADRYGPRWILVPSFIVLGLSLAATGRATKLWEVYLLGVGVGMAAAGPFSCIISTVAKWHGKRRGMALGLAASGLGLSNVIFPPLATKLIQAWHWRNAMVMLGLLTMCIGVVNSLVIKNPSSPSSRSSVVPRLRNDLFGTWRLLPKLMRNSAFAGIVAIMALSLTTSSLLTSHLVNYATDIGITALAAAALMSGVGIGSSFGRLAMGAISDKIGTKADLTICSLLLTVSVLLLISKVYWLMWVAAILFGIGVGATTPLVPAIMAERVTTEHLSTATGAVMVALFVGGGFGPWLGGVLYDVSGSYLPALLLATAFTLVALGITLWLPKKGHPLWHKVHNLFHS